MGNKYEVYLAGRIANLSYDEATVKRDEMVEKLSVVGIKCRTPLRGRQHLENVEKLTGDAFKCGLTINEVIHRDLSDVEKVDAVLVLTGDDPSWGTAGEFWYATWVTNTPTLVIAKKYVGSWLERFATRIEPDFDSAVQVLQHWKKYWDGSGVHSKR